MARRRMNLYVWEGVFCAYWEGMAAAIAPSLGGAIEAVAESYCGSGSNASAEHMRGIARRDLAKATPEVVPVGLQETVRAWYVAGGD